MRAPTDKIDFVAVLVYAAGPGRRAVESHVFSASHPEIAYQCALAKGNEERRGREFEGLAELIATTDDTPRIAKTEAGDARELITPKERLSAFEDARWTGILHNPDELASAFAEAPLLIEIPGLDNIDWSRLSYAYGPATDVPLDLQRLASSNADMRANALWQLGGGIYHQGDVFDATAVAIPFLVMLASTPSLPNRNEILELLEAIATSAAAANPEAIRKGWAERRAKYPTLAFARPVEGIAEAQIAAGLAVKDALQRAKNTLSTLAEDPDNAIREHARSVLRALNRGSRGP